ncbi:Uroporphyrinogen III synthase HEM4 [Bosea sp. LC85]|uniref:uroporphyrinogen-III synthase n=1 Tax=Bosea sp. LC85 TaxID=1502851 RepID=UPI0004E31F9F|nr:uroporphyrinogen-III synthase [Bosea sp. LC85]KFC73136.1 Uroporphyrinogen III synthase HEM4 [Bosea sp. LC85]
MRVFVFRPQADAERSARALTAHGHEPIVAPLFDVVRLSEPVPKGTFAALILTSGNAVPALADAPAAWRDLPVFTVGARTAAKMRDAGFEDARSADGDRNDLIALIQRNIAMPARLLLVAGRDRHDDVAERLGKAGYEIASWTAYAAEAKPSLPEAAAASLRDGRAEAALHYSPRGAQTFLALTRASALSEQALELTHVTLSAEVAAPLIAAGASTVLVAEYPEEAALLAALDQVTARNRRAEDVRQAVTAPAGVETDKDAMSEPQTSTPRGRHRRTPPTIDGKAEEAATAAPEVASSETDQVPPAATQSGEFTHESAPPAPEPIGLPPSDSAPPVVGQPSPPSRLPWAALAATGLIGGVLGAGLMMLVDSRSTPDTSEQQIAELKGRIETLQRTTTSLQGAVTSLPQRAALEALDRRVSATSEAATNAVAEAKTATARLAELANAPVPATVENSSAIAGLTQRLGTVETLAKSAASPSPQAFAAARIVLAERIQGALSAGRPFTADIAALGKGGGSAEQLAALSAVATTGAPTQDALLAQFRLHRAMFDREMTPAAKDWQDRLLGLASKVVTIRPVGDSGANDPATLVIRLENALAHSEFGKAAGLWAQLPEPARRDSAEFGAGLQKRAAAEAAIGRIAQDAVAALGAGG